MRYGYFDNKKLRYVIDPDRRPGLLDQLHWRKPDVRVLSHCRGGYSFSATPNTPRITRFAKSRCRWIGLGTGFTLRRRRGWGLYGPVTWQPVGSPGPGEI